jgi:signal transduction histidine kinase/DNA-binding response OmpR family regulator
MKVIDDQEYHLQVLEFRRDYLNRTLLLLGIVVWLIGSIFLLLNASIKVFLFVLLFEAVIVLSFYIGRRTILTLAEILLTVGSLSCLLILIQWVHEPMLLVLLIVATSIYSTLFNKIWTAVVTVSIVIIELIVIRSQFPALWSGWQVIIIPLTTILASILSRLREYNFELILVWAATSTQSAIAHMEEAREHRGKLFRSMKDLNDAYHRLERANEMLLEARSEAEKARQAQKQFALTISHELRTPLSFIIGFSEVMVNSPQVYGDPSTWPQGLYEDIQDIYRSSQHLLNLVNDVLDLGKVDANRLLLVKETISPTLIVREAHAIMQEAVSAKGLTLSMKMDHDLPDLYIDRTRIRQVLINLMNNALRFTEQGGITVSVSKHSDGVLFSVSDTGMGIPESEIPKVFEDFGQVNDTVWHKRDGSGLGVPISQRFVEMHGGRIWLESTVGQGTTFYFVIPLPETVNWPPWPMELETNDYWKFKEKENQAVQLLLVLSPDPGSAKVIENILEGYQVSFVSDIREAQQKIEFLMPRALIIDQILQDRLEISQLIQDLPYDLPVLVFAIPGTVSSFHQLPEGVVDYLPKPILRENLYKAFQRLEKPVRRLWIIDDDESMVRFVRLAFASSPMGEPPKILGALCGKDALKLINEESGLLQTEAIPDVILLDLGLPDMTGWDLLPQLREIFEKFNIVPPPVILITAALLSEELEARKRKVVQISTMEPLSSDNLGVVIRDLLQVVRPRFTSDRNEPAASGIPVEKKAS